MAEISLEKTTKVLYTMIKVKDMIIGNNYVVDGVTKTLNRKEMAGLGGRGIKNPIIICTLTTMKNVQKNGMMYIQVCKCAKLISTSIYLLK